jgi:hypothetical protein
MKVESKSNKNILTAGRKVQTEKQRKESHMKNKRNWNYVTTNKGMLAATINLEAKMNFLLKSCSEHSSANTLTSDFDFQN